MTTYTITRNNETIGKVAAFSRIDAAAIFAARLDKRAFARKEADGTFQATVRRPKLARFETVGEPYRVLTPEENQSRYMAHLDPVGASVA